MNIKITNRKAWSDDENRAQVALYLVFYAKQKSGEKYQKASSVRALAEKLGRTKGSIEAKLMNVSGVMVDLERDWVNGYKPLSNYNKALRDTVVSML